MKRLGVGVVEEGFRKGATIARASVQIASVLATASAFPGPRKSDQARVPFAVGETASSPLSWKTTLPGLAGWSEAPASRLDVLNDVVGGERTIKVDRNAVIFSNENDAKIANPQSSHLASCTKFKNSIRRNIINKPDIK